MVEVFRDWFEHRHEYAKDWQKRTEGKVLGYFCTYAPEEIMYAAGQLPKFRDNLYHDVEDDKWMVPTAEVPITGMH